MGLKIANNKKYKTLSFVGICTALKKGLKLKKDGIIKV